jgi:hypothetical protein
MPAESTRLRRSLGRRDRRFLAIVAAAIVLGTPVGLVLAERTPKPPAGCTRRLERGFMGGQTATICRNPSRKSALDGPARDHQTRQSDARRDERLKARPFVRHAARLALVGVPLRQAD